MDRVLRDLQGEGEHDSSGDWTLDFQQARRKLGRYQLSGPGDYLLKFVQACVAGGATEIQARIGATRVELRANPRKFDPEELPKLGTYLLRSTSLTEPRHMRHLAVGLNSALWLEPQSLELRFPTLKWTPEKDWEEHQDGPPFQLKVKRRFPAPSPDLTNQMFEAMMTAHIPEIPWAMACRMLPEAQALNTRCSFSAVPIELNGIQVNRPVVPLEPNYLQYFFLAGDEPPAELLAFPRHVPARFTRYHHAPSLHALPAHSRPPLNRLEQARTLPGSNKAVLMAHGWLSLSFKHTTLLFVKDGVMLNPVTTELDCPGVRGYLSGHGLATDLSEFQLVEDDALRGLINRVNSQVRLMAEDLRERIYASRFARYTWASGLLSRLPS